MVDERIARGSVLPSILCSRHLLVLVAICTCYLLIGRVLTLCGRPEL